MPSTSFESADSIVSIRHKLKVFAQFMFPTHSDWSRFRRMIIAAEMQENSRQRLEKGRMP